MVSLVFSLTTVFASFLVAVAAAIGTVEATVAAGTVEAAATTAVLGEGGGVGSVATAFFL